VVSSHAYLSDPEFSASPGRKVFNLCRSYRYQSAGYYVSLLAEARAHRPLPSITAIQDLRLSSVIRLVSQDLDGLIQSNLRRIRSDHFELSVYFGRNLARAHDQLALAIFNAFPVPMMRARFERNGAWRLVSVRAIGVGEVPDSHRPFLIEQAERYLRRAPRRTHAGPPPRFDLAILHDPSDPMPPSDPDALKSFCRAGEALGIRCELIERDAYGRLAEFDGLFIRETTAVDHHTYRFARRAAAEGLVVIDDPVSIVRCTNKVYLAEALARHKIATPMTVTFGREGAGEAPRATGFPCVLKRPDSSFSAGVVKVESAEDFERTVLALFEETDLLVAQEFVPTDFDWRIGVLDGRPLYASRYFMAEGHWQIVKRDAAGVHEGAWETVPIEEAPADIVRLGTRAAGVIGHGLYGVDLKVVRGRPVVIEINDNPNIDSGVEDGVLGDELYARVMRHFLEAMEARRA
jgi:glutathione synthase/RimK-type ligase-like ATP-grasp enzyme